MHIRSFSIATGALAALAPIFAAAQDPGGAHAGHGVCPAVEAAAHGAAAGHGSHADHARHAAGRAAGRGRGAAADTGFAALQRRGRAAMGVDQYTSTHVFDALPDGGRIELQRDVDDAEGVAEIRRHLQDIACRFQQGDFAIPGFVHAQEVPGTAVLADKKDVITYTFHPLPRGGEVLIRTSDPEALRAIGEFMAFQRSDHRAHGRTGR